MCNGQVSFLRLERAKVSNEHIITTSATLMQDRNGSRMLLRKYSERVNSGRGYYCDKEGHQQSINASAKAQEDQLGKRCNPTGKLTNGLRSIREESVLIMENLDKALVVRVNGGRAPNIVSIEVVWIGGIKGDKFRICESGRDSICRRLFGWRHPNSERTL